MLLTNKECNIIHKKLLRFLKEYNLYKYLKKNGINKYEKLMDYIVDADFIDNTYGKFALQHMTKQATLQEQVMFSEFVKSLTEKTTEELFLEFLDKESVSYEELVSLFKKIYNTYKGINQYEYNTRLKVLEIYKPHIMASLYAIRCDKIKENNMNFSIFKEKWINYYKLNLKIIQ